MFFLQRKIWQAADLFVISLSHKNSTLKQLQWTSDNASVAAVDQDGYVTAINVGTATITAIITDGSNISASCVITVININTVINNNMIINKSRYF